MAVSHSYSAKGTATAVKPVPGITVAVDRRIRVGITMLGGGTIVSDATVGRGEDVGRGLGVGTKLGDVLGTAVGDGSAAAPAVTALSGIPVAAIVVVLPGVGVSDAAASTYVRADTSKAKVAVPFKDVSVSRWPVASVTRTGPFFPGVGKNSVCETSGITLPLLSAGLMITTIP